MPIHFELVTPEKLLRSEDVYMVTVPGTEGDFGVLQGHAPFMSTIRDGELRIYARDGAEPETLLIKGGLLDKPSFGTQAAGALSLVYALIILLIVLGNVGYYASQAAKKRQAR